MNLLTGRRECGVRLGLRAARSGGLASLLLVALSCIHPNPQGTVYDIVIRGGTIYNGLGGAPYVGNIGIVGDRIAVTGDFSMQQAKLEIDARGMAVAPGFINMLSWANESLIQDGRSQGDIRQGVTLEVMGEGTSMGPLTEKMRQEMIADQGDIKYEVPWTTLGEYLEYLVKKGISPNVASFVGATSLRVHEIGYADRAPTLEEMQRMQALARQAMEEGAMGIASALIYAPAFYAKTDELIALSKAVAPYGGMYISHMRSEGARLLEAIDELITISREAGVWAEIYHLKAAGQQNWGKLGAAIAKVERARSSGLHITADMYNYIAGATGLDASMPPWVQEGGYKEWAARLKDPAIRSRVAQEMRTPTDKWENYFLGVGSPDKIMLISFKTDSLKYLTGKTLAEVARMRGKSPEETAMDLVIQDGSRVEAVYFLMSEENVRRQLQLPWVSFNSDAGSYAPEGLFLKSSVHPRAYGSFARLLGKYVRDEKILSMQDAIRRLTAFPAENLKLRDRGKLVPGYYADIVIFDPRTIQDHATFEKPHQYSTGVRDVFVNGVQVLRNGEHTGALPGRVIRGPGWRGWK